MAEFNLQSVIDRYQSAFGYVGGNFAKVFGLLDTYNQDGQSSGSFISNLSLFTVQSVYFADVTLTSAASGKVYYFGLRFDDKNYVCPPVMLQFSRDKHVVETQIDRSEIHVIEYFGLKPWEISFQGILIDQEDHHYPGDKVTKISELFSQTGTFNVSGELFTNLGITELFINKDLKINHVEGFVDTIKFSFQAISTFPLEVIQRL